MPDQAIPPVLRALLDAGGALARRTATTKVALAKLADVLDPELVPGDVRDRVRAELERAHAEAAVPLSRKELERELESAWGTKPGKVLDALDEEPLSVGPGAQVHVGELDGTRVAVKVRRPGLDRNVRSDLSLLDALVPAIRAAFPALDAGGILRAARELALDELDLEHQAGTMRSVARALRGAEGVSAPKALGEHCAPSVLVTELVAGRPLVPDPPAGAAATLLRAHAAVARAGWVLYDVTPSHVLVLDDGTLGLLGTGKAAPVDAGRVALAREAVRAARADDPGAFAATVSGLLPEEQARRAHALGQELGAPLLDGPAALDARLAARTIARAADRIPEGLAIGAAATPAPGDVAAGRGLGQLAATLARLGQTEDWPALALDALEDR